MELHGLFGLCWCVLSGSRKLAAGNNEEGWSRIDEEEQAMAVNAWELEKAEWEDFWEA
jgi:hypothetical protein